MINKFFVYCVLAVICSSCSLSQIKKPPKSLKVETIHGDFVVDDPLTLELIFSDPMQRLKNITQYGTYDFVRSSPRPYDRFAHSLGVYYLLKRHGAPYKEQIAGLLHDISHTAFSHTTDALFMGNLVSGAYQDQIHLQFLREHGIEKILNKYGMTIGDMDIYERPYRALKQKHPELCADRIEYIIYAGYKEGLFSKEDVLKINRSLNYAYGTWFFDDLAQAKKFAEVSVRESVASWGGKLAIFINYKSTELLRVALKEQVISLKDLLYAKSDNEIWQLLHESKNIEISHLIRELQDHERIIRLGPSTCSKRFFAKFRGVDPLVRLSSNELERLSKLDIEFRSLFDLTKNEVESGYCLPLD